MKKLGERNYSLISGGVKAFGTFNPEKIYFIFEEQLYINEADEIWNFLQWCYDNDKKFGHGNYEECFAEFKRAVVEYKAQS